MLIPSRQSKLGTMPAHFYPTNVTSSPCCRTIDHADVRDRSSDVRPTCGRRAADVAMFARHSAKLCTPTEHQSCDITPVTAALHSS